MTEIQIPYLPTAQFFKIRCRLGINEQDIIGDSDSDPQIRTIGGTVSISASIPRFRYTEADGRKRVVYTKTETYNIQTSTGELFDADGNIGVNLLNTNSPQMDPQGWTYKATVRPNGGEPFDVPIPSDGGGEVFDLGDGLVFTPSTGITDLETRVKALEDSAGTVTPPGGGSSAVSSVAGRTGDVVLSSADLTDVDTLATDAELTAGLAGKANTSHPHTSTNITDWAEAVQDTVVAMLVSGANVTLAYDDAAGKVIVTAAGGDAEVMRDTIGAALVGVGGVSIAINDAADTITLSISGVNSTQVTDFAEATQDVVGAMVAAAGGTYDDTAGTITLPSGGGGGGWELIASTPVVGHGTATFASIPQTYDKLRLEWLMNTSDSGGRNCYLTCNGDTGANYATNGNAGGQSSIPILAPQGRAQGFVECHSYRTPNAGGHIFAGQVVGNTNAGNNNIALNLIGGGYLVDAAITSLSMTLSSNENGIFYLYGATR